MEGTGKMKTMKKSYFKISPEKRAEAYRQLKIEQKKRRIECRRALWEKAQRDGPESIWAEMLAEDIERNRRSSKKA